MVLGQIWCYIKSNKLYLLAKQTDINAFTAKQSGNVVD